MITYKRDGIMFKNPEVSGIRKLLFDIRNAVVTHIRDYTRDRILQRSQGAGGTPLEGYSQNPLIVDYPGELKPKRKPVGGMPIYGEAGQDGMYFHGGYEEYREKAGLTANRFIFFNLGNAWRDWQVLQYGDINQYGGSSTNTIGFGDASNAIAATAAEKKRPLMFKMTNGEVGLVNNKVVDMINRLFFP